MHPLEYFATAPDDTPDAAILKEMVSRYGHYLERLDSEQKLALRAVLSYYLFYKLKYSSHYAVSDAIIDAMPECTTASLSKIILTLEGISSENALGLIKFLTEQRQERAVVLGEAAPKSKTQPLVVSSGFGTFAFFSKTLIPASTTSKPLSVGCPSLPLTAPPQSRSSRRISFSFPPTQGIYSSREGDSVLVGEPYFNLFVSCWHSNWCVS